MALEEKYSKPKTDYYVSVIWRKITASILANPEFMFIIKIGVAIVAAFIIFTIFRNTFGLL